MEALGEGDTEVRLGLPARLALGVVVVLACLLLVSRILGVELVEAVQHVNPILLACFLATLLATESLRGIRLMLLAQCIGARPSFVRALASRVVGSLVSALTPSAAGGEVLRGLLASGRLEAGAAVVGVVDGAMDLVANYVYAVALAPCVLPVAPAYVAAGLGLGLVPVLLWTAGLAGARFALRLSRKGPSWLRRGVEAFTSLRGVLTGWRGFVLWAITGVSWLLQCLQLMVVCLFVCPAGLLDVVAGFTYASLMGLIPVPGGAGIFELVASVFVCPEATVVWRVVWLLSLVIASLALLPLVLSPSSLVEEHSDG